MDQLEGWDFAKWFQQGEEKLHFELGVGVFKIKYLLNHLSNRFLKALCSTCDSYFILLYINQGWLWFVIDRKSIHGNKFNFIGWLQYLHIFVNEKIADKYKNGPADSTKCFA